MDKEVSTQQFHPHNNTKSPLVEEFLTAFDKGERGTALRLLDDQKVFVVDEEYLSNMRNRIEHYLQKSTSQSEAIEEIKSERDDLLKGLYSIYNSFGFLINAVKKGVKSEKPLKGVNAIRLMLKTFGFKDADTAVINIIVAIIISIKKNYKKVVENIPNLGDDLLPGLKILEKHDIIPTLEIEDNGKDEKQ
jgi:hypothetical protein